MLLFLPYIGMIMWHSLVLSGILCARTSTLDFAASISQISFHQKRKTNYLKKSNGGKLSCYHDRYDLEADAPLHLDDGRYALIEFKLGSREIEEGATHLLQLKELVRKYNEKETQAPLRVPDLLMVITGGEMACTREDGVKIIPIGALRDQAKEIYPP